MKIPFADKIEGRGTSGIKDEAGRWTEVRRPSNEDKKKIVSCETIHEVVIVKRLSGARCPLQERRELKKKVVIDLSIFA